MKNLLLFANIRVDDHIRLNRLKNSICSLNGVKFWKYIINVRGNLKEITKKFLKKQLQGKNFKLTSIETKYGWKHDSLYLLKDISENCHIFNWIEDHLMVCSPKYFNRVIKELVKKEEIDMLVYSWFCKKFRAPYLALDTLKKTNFFFYGFINKYSFASLKLKGFKNIDITTAVSISRKNFFIGILNSNKPFLLRWSHMSPFDIELTFRDNAFKEVTIAIPKKELLASIDDDKEPGYSLISRAKYDFDISRKEMRLNERPFTLRLIKIMKIDKNIIVKKFLIILRRVYFTAKYFLVKIN